MAIAEITGSASISTTEYSLATSTNYDTGDAQTTDGEVVCVLDLNALANGDVYEVKFYEKARSGDTQRLAWSQTFSNVQGQPISYTPTFRVLHGWDFTLKKLSGTDRTINWSIRRDYDDGDTSQGEPAQGAPAAAQTRWAKIDYLYKAWRNRSTQTSTTYSLYADDATTVDQKATVSDNGTTAERGEIASGP